MNRMSTGMQMLLGVCMLAAAVLTWKTTGVLLETIVWAGFSVPFFVGVVRNLVRWNRRTDLVTKQERR